MRLYDSTTLAQTAIMYGHRAAVRCCRFSPDSRRIISGSEDTTLKLYVYHPLLLTPIGLCVFIYFPVKQNNRWETRRHCKVATFSGHTKAVTCVAFSPDSRTVVSGSDDKTLIEWNATNAKKIAQWTKHKAPITDVAYSTDGNFPPPLSRSPSFFYPVTHNKHSQ